MRTAIDRMMRGGRRRGYHESGCSRATRARDAIRVLLPSFPAGGGRPAPGSRCAFRSVPPARRAHRPDGAGARGQGRRGVLCGNRNELEWRSNPPWSSAPGSPESPPPATCRYGRRSAALWRKWLQQRAHAAWPPTSHSTRRGAWPPHWPRERTCPTMPVCSACPLRRLGPTRPPGDHRPPEHPVAGRIAPRVGRRRAAGSSIASPEHLT